MSIDRMVRVNEILRREIAGAIVALTATDPLFDASCVTVTRVITSRSLRHARVFVSILGHEHERGTILERLRRHGGELQAVVGRHVRLKYTPRIIIEADPGLERGDRMLHLLDELVDEPGGDPAADAAAADMTEDPRP